MRKEGIYKLEDGQFKIEGYEILADFPHPEEEKMEDVMLKVDSMIYELKHF
ncbi:MAG: hypothetical protein N2Z81_02965 [Hydrogenothermaceae bacterium]|nr:hypothetical protein [Hydrogenothermaceae bacterium]